MQTPNQIFLQEGAFVKYSRGNRSPYQNLNNNNKLPSLLNSLTLHIAHTYTRCDPNFQYSNNLNPRRVLTKPSEPTNANEHWDNENSDYILFVNDILGSYSKHQYQVVDLLGQGTFGQVVKSINIDTHETVAIKVVKNKPAYFNQGLVEIQILEMLNHQYDPENKGHIVRLTDYFVFRNHLCLVFECLSVNLFELIKQNQFRGLSMTLIRCFLIQILEAMQVLVHANVVHCDLKPENILLENLSSPAIKLIDFGSACLEDRTVYTYIQSRFYRSPEVLVGLKYTSSIDMWSLGCISAELFLGLPLFPGSSEYNQLYRIIDMLGPLPDHVLERGTKSPKYFNRATVDNRLTYMLKSEEQYAHENEIPVQPTKKYFKYKTLPEIIFNYAMKEGLSPQEIQKERDLRRAFVHFLTGLLNPDPALRWTPDQARTHPFIKGEPFDGSFVPEPPTRLRQTQPRIIPWGIQNAALAQKPVSMSYPDQMMEFDDPASYSPRGFVGSMKPESMLGSSPYGSSFGSYGFAPGSAPNAFMLQHIQQQQQQLQIKAAQQQKMQQMQYSPNTGAQPMQIHQQQNSPNTFASTSLPDNRRQRSKSDAFKNRNNHPNNSYNSPSGPTTPRNNNNRGHTEYGSYHDNRQPRNSFDAAMGNNNKGKRTIDQQNKHHDNRRRGSWVPQNERSPNQVSPRQPTQQMDTEDDFMFEFEQQQPNQSSAMDVSGSFSNLFISNNPKNEQDMYNNNNNTRERSNSYSKHNRYPNNKKDNSYSRNPKGNT